MELTKKELELLYNLQKCENLRQISRKTKINYSYAVIVSNKLRKLGLLDKIPKNGRENKVILTEEGKECMKKIV